MRHFTIINKLGNSKNENIQRPPSLRKLQKWPILGILEIYNGDLPHQNLIQKLKN